MGREAVAKIGIVLAAVGFGLAWSLLAYQMAVSSEDILAKFVAVTAMIISLRCAIESFIRLERWYTDGEETE